MSQTQNEIADRIIREHVAWSVAAGLVPIPFADVAAVSAVQLDMLSRLAATYGVRFSLLDARSVVSALVGGGAAHLGARLLKLVPGVGTVAGGISMSIASGASTYAVGRVAVNQFASGLDLGSLSLDRARELYAEAFDRGKDVAAGVEDRAGGSDVVAAIEGLGRLHEQGLLTDEELQRKKEELLGRL